MFAIRLVLAATLASNYGIYGPAFELLENRPRAPGSEEYLDSEKYQLRRWDLDRPGNLRDLIARLNASARPTRRCSAWAVCASSPPTTRSFSPS